MTALPGGDMTLRPFDQCLQVQELLGACIFAGKNDMQLLEQGKNHLASAFESLADLSEKQANDRVYLRDVRKSERDCIELLSQIKKEVNLCRQVVNTMLQKLLVLGDSHDESAAVEKLFLAPLDKPMLDVNVINISALILSQQEAPASDNAEKVDEARKLARGLIDTSSLLVTRLENLTVLSTNIDQLHAAMERSLTSAQARSSAQQKESARFEESLAAYETMLATLQQHLLQRTHDLTNVQQVVTHFEQASWDYSQHQQRVVESINNFQSSFKDQQIVTAHCEKKLRYIVELLGRDSEQPAAEADISRRQAMTAQQALTQLQQIKVSTDELSAMLRFSA